MLGRIDYAQVVEAHAVSRALSHQIHGDQMHRGTVAARRLERLALNESEAILTRANLFGEVAEHLRVHGLSKGARYVRALARVASSTTRRRTLADALAVIEGA